MVSFANMGPVLLVITYYLANPLLLSIIGCRLLINMREALEYGANAGTSCGKPTVTAMDFAGPPAEITQDSAEIV